MDSYGKLFKKGEPPVKSRLLAEYERAAAGGFTELDSFNDRELLRLQRLHDKHLDYYREERRMHFGAFALVGLAFIILFPALLTVEQSFLALAGVETLLFVLLVPYVFVYRRYEEGVRRMMKESLVIENARELLRDKTEESNEEF